MARATAPSSVSGGSRWGGVGRAAGGTAATMLLLMLGDMLLGGSAERVGAWLAGEKPELWRYLGLRRQEMPPAQEASRLSPIEPLNLKADENPFLAALRRSIFDRLLEGIF